MIIDITRRSHFVTRSWFVVGAVVVAVIVFDQRYWVPYYSNTINSVRLIVTKLDLKTKTSESIFKKKPCAVHFNSLELASILATYHKSVLHNFFGLIVSLLHHFSICISSFYANGLHNILIWIRKLTVLLRLSAWQIIW